MLLTSITAAITPLIPIIVPALLAWCALALLWPDVGRILRIQVAVFLAAGIAALVWATARGAGAPLMQMLGQNQLIISMLASIGLLRLLNPPVHANEPELPRGMGTYVRSMFGVHSFAAVLNISALVIMADRLVRARPLQANQAQMLSRAFTVVAFYSPFIGGVALALNYTPGSSLTGLMLFGVPLACCGLAIVFWYARSGRVAGIDEFRGYPVHFESLWLPAALVVAVLLVQSQAPELSVLTLITMITPPVVVIALWLTRGRIALGRSIGSYVHRRLPEMSGELALFIGAGVLSAGLVALSSTWSDWLPIARFDWLAAGVFLLIVLLTSLLCIHPVVPVSVGAPLLLPLNPDPTMLAIVFAVAWGTGCAINPMSGTNLILNSRYGVNNWAVGHRNIAYSFALSLIAVAMLFGYERIVTG